jgi:murein DD-endopeptidase MepM/ murein hydrolase activator NlpD
LARKGSVSSLLQRYKSAERGIYKKIASGLAAGALRARRTGERFFRLGNQGLSILIVSHNEQSPRGIRLSLFGLSGIAMLSAAFIVLLFTFSGSLGGVSARVSASSVELARAQNELDEVKAETGRLAAAYQDFEGALEPIMASGSSYSPILPAKKTVAGTLFAKRRGEAQSLAEIRERLDQSAPVISEYGSMLGQMDAVKHTVPAIWPIAGGIGHISTTFGTNPNPFTGQSYFHTGIDASTYRSGDLLVATGDGKVIFAGVEGGYGRCVIIAHAYGYLTRFGHMDKILVHSGQTVKQGQGIGILGNTGVSTAPHTHYEVILGHSYLDPTDYLWLGHYPIITGGGSAD